MLATWVKTLYLLRILKGKTGRYTPNTDILCQIMCQKNKNCWEHAKNILEAQRKTFIFHYFYLPKSRKSELHNVLHGIRAPLKFCSFRHIPIGYSQYLHLHCTTIIIVLSCLYSMRSLKVIRFPLLKFKNRLRTSVSSRLKLPRK